MKVTLKSVVVSTMVSETKIFNCYEYPEWMRLFWVLWAYLPVLLVEPARFIDDILKTTYSLILDFFRVWPAWAVGTG